MVALSGVSIGAGIVGGILAPSIILDIVSFWPLVIIPLVVAIVLWIRKSSRAGAMPPLLLITIILLVVVVHLLGWSKLPSAAADLIGPRTQEGTVSLSVSLQGRLTIRAAASPLYEIKLDRVGGSLGVPEALERSTDGSLTVDVQERDGGRWFRTDGWTALLARGAVWKLQLSSPQLDADLRELALDTLTIDGAGTVLLGPSPSTVTVNGTVTIGVASGSAVEVHGDATVPAGWEQTEDGYRSPGTGPTVTIAVTDGAQVVIEDV